MQDYQKSIQQYYSKLGWVIPSNQDASKIYVYILSRRMLVGELEPLFGARKLSHQLFYREEYDLIEVNTMYGSVSDIEEKLKELKESHLSESEVMHIGCKHILKWAQIAFDNYKPVYEKWKSSCKGSGE